MSTRIPPVPEYASTPMQDRVPSPMPSSVSTVTPRSVEAPGPAPERAHDGVIPHVRVRLGGVVAFAGLAVALLSLYLPWLSGGGSPVTAIALTDVLDLRAMMPINFLGLIALCALTSITLVTRLGVFALLNAAVATLVLVAHCAFVWVLIGSTGASDPLISGLPAGTSVSYGPYISALGFLLVIAGSVWAARAAEYQWPDRAEGHALMKAMKEAVTG